jgi:hypothetical protein
MARGRTGGDGGQGGMRGLGLWRQFRQKMIFISTVNCHFVIITFKIKYK